MTSFYDTQARVALSIYATALASRRVISEVKLAETLLAANACSQAPETDSANFDSRRRARRRPKPNPKLDCLCSQRRTGRASPVKGLLSSPRSLSCPPLLRVLTYLPGPSLLLILLLDHRHQLFSVEHLPASNMPITRALSSRLRSGSRRQSTPASAINHPTEDVSVLKSQAQAAAAVVEPARALVASALAELNVHTTAKDAGSTSGSSSYAASTAASTTSTSSRPRYSRGTSRLSSRRSVLGSSEFGDSSDDENDDKGQQRRIGGCSSRITTADQPDDSNKENVAPFRCTSQDVLDAEARDVQHEHAIRRTTPCRRTSLMERPSFAPSPRLSRSSTVSDLSASSQGEYLVLHCACSYSTTDRPWIGGRRPDRLAADQGCSTVTLAKWTKKLHSGRSHFVLGICSARCSFQCSFPAVTQLGSACLPVCLSVNPRRANLRVGSRIAASHCQSARGRLQMPFSQVHAAHHPHHPFLLLAFPNPPLCIDLVSHCLLSLLFYCCISVPCTPRHSLPTHFDTPHTALSPCQFLPSREPPRGD